MKAFAMFLTLAVASICSAETMILKLDKTEIKATETAAAKSVYMVADKELSTLDNVNSERRQQ